MIRKVGKNPADTYNVGALHIDTCAHTDTHHTQNRSEARRFTIQTPCPNHPSFLPDLSFRPLGPRPARIGKAVLWSGCLEWWKAHGAGSQDVDSSSGDATGPE